MKVGSGISIVIIEQPHRRIFSMFVGSHSGNQRTQGFYLIASKFNNESNAEKMPNYFFNGILRNDRLFKGFRKELNCKYHEYLG